MALSRPPSLLSSAPTRISAAAGKSVGMVVTRDNAPWRRWYDTARWKALRLATFVRDHFTCQMCGRIEGQTRFLVCDHVKAHRGNAVLFWDPANLQTLCKSPCHDKHKQALEQSSLGQRGVWD